MVNKPNIYIYVYKGGITIGIFKNNSGQVGVGIIVVAIIVIAGLLLLNPFVKVDAGEVGIVKKWGEVQNTVLEEGLHPRMPIKTEVEIMTARTLKYETSATAASQDIQQTTTTITLNYHIVGSTANRLFQEVGMSYEDIIIAPAIQDAVKSVTPRFVAVELVTERPTVRGEMEALLKAALIERGIVVENVYITDFSFSNKFNAAIEEKVKAEQEAQKALNDLKRIEIEAQQVMVQADADAYVIQVIEEQLSQSPTYVDYLAVLAWDGKLPTITGGVLPMIDVTGIAAAEA